MTTIDPTEALLAALRSHGLEPRRSGDGWACRCPAHDDHTPSLRIGVGDDDRALIYCHKGCPVEAVVAAVGLTMEDLLPQANDPRKTKRGIVAYYDYRDEVGHVVFQVVRFTPKDFRQRAPKPGGGWDWSVKRARIIPYRLPELLADPTQPVAVVEGEKDADALHRIGVVATCNAGGASKWTAEHAAFLSGRRVIVMPDNDNAGRNHAHQVARSLEGIAESVQIVELPDLPAKGDVSDWLEAGGSKAALNRLIDTAPIWTRAAQYAASTPRHAARLIRMSDVAPTEIRWLWPGRIPVGRLTLLVGRPGDGKSFLTAHLAAHVSRGAQWIDGGECPTGSVILCSAEDDPADTIAPRLIAHNADRSRVHLLAGVTSRDGDGEETERIFTLADLPALRQTLQEISNCKLIVIDPIGSYLGGRADAHRDNEVRGVLAPVCQLAAQYEAALVVVGHTRKAVAANADDMAMGSRAFTGLARSVLHLMIDPDDETKSRRLLLPGKNNLAERPPGLAFDIGPSDIDGWACIRWLPGEVKMTADEAVNRDSQQRGKKDTEQDDAAHWLKRILANGPMPAKEVRDLARESKGIANRTLDRAKKKARVEAFRRENPGPWYWSLPCSGAERHTHDGERDGALAICPGESARGDFGASKEAHCHSATSAEIGDVLSSDDGWADAVNAPSLEPARLLVDLGAAGIELAPDPTDAAKLRHRPRALPSTLAARLGHAEEALLALLRGEGVPDETDAENGGGHVMAERMGMAEELGHPTHPGSPAWLIAAGESMSEQAIHDTP